MKMIDDNQKARYNDIKVINTEGIGNIQKLEGSLTWYWGQDWSCGDLYEAEEVYLSTGRVKGNRFLLIKYPEGEVIEPLPSVENNYFGLPVYDDGRVIFFRVDFANKKIVLYAYTDETKELCVIASLEMELINNCENLLLHRFPTFLSKTDEQYCHILWPEKSSFALEENEVLYKREGKHLFTSKWKEDPSYSEEFLLREYPSGTIVHRQEGILIEMPNFDNWLLK